MTTLEKSVCVNYILTKEKKNMGILEQFQKQVEIDKECENYNMPENIEQNDGQLSEEEYEIYKETLDSLRNEMYNEVPKKMTQMVVNRSYPNNLIRKNENADTDKEKASRVQGDISLFDESLLNCTVSSPDYVKIAIKRAKCPFCGEEIVSGETTTYRCNNCGNLYVTDKKYPRVVLLDENNDELKINF